MQTNAKHLLSYVKKASPVIPKNPVVPIVENYLFESVEGLLQITATDMRTTIKVKTDIEFHEKFLVPSLFLDTLNTIGDKPIDVVFDKSNLGITIKSGRSKIKLASEDANDFPKLPEVEYTTYINLPRSEFDVLNSMVKFSGTDEHRPAMTGLYLNGKGKLSCASTDGHRLYSYDSVNEVEGELNHIIPASVFKALGSSLSGDISISLHNSNVSFTDGNTTVVTRLIDERYPDYRNALPQNNPNQAKLFNGELQASLQRVLLCTNKTTNQVKLSFSKDGVLTISAEDLDYSNEAVDTLDLIEYEGENLEIGFNGKYLLELLKSLGDSVVIELSLPNRAAIFRNDGDLSKTLLLMPVMLNQNI